VVNGNAAQAVNASLGDIVDVYPLQGPGQL
jgi:hypothetical protein